MFKDVSSHLPFILKKEGKEELSSPIVIHTDGASRGNPGLAGIGYTIHLGDEFLRGKHFIGTTTNNIAEYQALIYALRLLTTKGILKPLVIYTDSQLMARQLNGVYRIKQPHLRILAEKIYDLLRFFPSYEIIHISRSENKEADRLANEAIDELKKSR